MGFEPMKDVSPPLTDYQSAPISPPLARLRFDKRDKSANSCPSKKSIAINNHVFKTRHLTKRAPDVWDAGAFTRLIQARSFILITSVIYALPHAGNANR